MKGIYIICSIIACVALAATVNDKAEGIEGIQHVAGFNGELLLENLPVIYLTGEEYELMAHVVMAEAEGEPLEGKIAVANTIINRKRNRGISVTEVIFAPAQFHTGGRFKLEPTPECYEAVDMALRGHEAIDNDVEHFCEHSITFNNLAYVKTIGNHDFYKEDKN